jgi:hypothetical protein
MTTELQVVFVSSEGMFFKIDAMDFTVHPFPNLIKSVHKMYIDKVNVYVMVKVSQLIFEHILSKANVQYTLMTMSFFDALNIIINMTDVNTTSSVCEEDTIPNPIDDFLTSLTEDEVSTHMTMDVDTSMIETEE